MERRLVERSRRKILSFDVVMVFFRAFLNESSSSKLAIAFFFLELSFYFFEILRRWRMKHG